MYEKKENKFSLFGKVSSKDKDSFENIQNLEQSHEMGHHNIFSLMAALRKFPDYEPTKEQDYGQAYQEYLIHLLSYGYLNIEPSYEFNSFYKVIKDCQQENQHPSEYKNCTNFYFRLLLSTQINGNDSIHFYKLLNDVLTGKEHYLWAQNLLGIKNEYFLKLLTGINTVTRQHEKRSNYIVETLIPSIKYCMLNNLSIFSLTTDKNGLMLLELMQYCLNLNLFEKHKKDLLSIIKIYILEKYSIDNDNQYVDCDIDALGIFKISQFLIKQKEYETFKELVNIFLDRECSLYNDEEKLNVLVYSVILLEKIPPELNEICELIIDNRFKPLFISNSLADWKHYVFQRNDAPFCFYVDLYNSKIIKKYSINEIMHYFLKSADNCFLDSDSGLNSDMNDFRKLSEELYLRSFIKNLIICFDKEELKFLDLQNKKNLLTLYSVYNIYPEQFNIFNLLQNLHKEAQQDLLNYYESIFGVYKITNHTFDVAAFILSIYPLDAGIKPISHLEQNKNLPSLFHQYCLTHEKIIPPSFGLGLFQMDCDFTALPFQELVPLLKDRDALILSNNEFFYADLKREKITRTIKCTTSNQSDMSALKSMCGTEYQLADEKAYQLIVSLIGISTSFERFYQRFQDASQHLLEQAGEHNVVDYNDLMLNKIIKLFNLYEFMGEDLFLFLMKMISPSPQKLERYLNNLLLIPTEYFNLLQLMQNKFHKEVISINSSSYDLFLLQIGQMELILNEVNYDEIPDEFLKLKLIKRLGYMLSEGKSVKELTEFFAKKIAVLYKMQLDLPTDMDLDLSRFSQDPFFMSRLLIARRTMNENQLCSVFDKLIEYDLRNDVQFTDFANNPNQADPLGKQLSLHNQKIENELSKALIDVKLALNYTKVIEFSTGCEDEIDLSVPARALYADLINLEQILEPPKNRITFFDEKNDIQLKYAKDLNDLQGWIKKILTQVKKQPGVLEGVVLQKTLNLIVGCLNKLFKQEVCLVPAELKEHGTHFLHHYKNILDSQEQIKNKPKLKKGRKKEFEMKQWDKNQLDTFLLGDYLSCCLAPDGGQFPAMVQRRMDSAMMMHVIYDKSLNQPVCGNWLFFAYNKSSPGDIYVVANFFEIRAGYGLNKELCKEMIGELLAFTGNYAQVIGAKGFLMRPLNYGLIPDFEELYPTTKMKIKKVGGFFSPDLEEESYQSKERYYLLALELDKFYKYKPEICEKESELNTRFRTF